MGSKTAPQQHTSERALVPTGRMSTYSLSSRSPACRLQQAIGNSAMTRVLNSGNIQPKLTVSHPEDESEREADRVADQVMRMPEAGATAAEGAPRVQAKPPATETSRRAKCESEPLKEKKQKAFVTRTIVQRLPLAMREDDDLEKIAPKLDTDHIPQEAKSIQNGSLLQRKSKTLVEDEDDQVSAKIRALPAGGRPLPAATRAFMESRFGADFSGVRLHTGSEAAQLNRAISAQAFTHRQDIYLGEGKNDLESSAGKHLLAHELTHTIQQRPAGATPPLIAHRDGVAAGSLGQHRAPNISKVSPVSSRLIQRSWTGDRIDWVRTATREDNWAGSDPPGAYYVLNGLSMDDMVRILRALTPADRKKLSANLDEHGAGFDRSRLQLGLTNAAAPAADKAFRESSENLHWAIRSGNYANAPDGAFYQLAAVHGKQRQRLLAALNRDALDALISHKDEAGSVPGGADVIDKIEGSRATVGQTGREKHLHDLIEGNAFQKFFIEFNGMNETDQLRFLKSSDLVDLSRIKNHTGAAAGIADPDRISNLIQRATTSASDNLYIDGAIHEYRWEPKYRVDPNHPQDFSRIISFGNAFAVELDINTIGDGQISDDEAEKQFREAKPGPGGFLWPAVRNRSTLPILWGVKQDVRKNMETVLLDPVLMAGIRVVQYFLTVVFPVVHGTVLRTLGALKRASFSTRWMMGSQAIKGRLPPTVPGSVRPRATPQQLREMIAESGEYYTWRTNKSDVAANQTIRSMKQTNPMAPEGVYLAKGVKGLPYGNYAVSIKGGKFPIRSHPFAAEEFILNGEIPANEGVWYTAEDYAAARGSAIKP